MKKDWIPFELALELKQLGFDESCSIFYIWLPAPTFSQAFRWFRDKHNLFGCIDLQSCEPAHWYIRIDNIIENDYLYHSEDENIQFETYEEAELACLKKLIETIR